MIRAERKGMNSLWSEEMLINRGMVELEMRSQSFSKEIIRVRKMMKCRCAR